MPKTTRSEAASQTAGNESDAIPLKQACVIAAREVIAAEGCAALSLRDVARRLGVSHQAPYRHYPTRDDLLAEVLRQCFAEFAQALAARTPHENAQDELGSLGDAYLGYAAAHPVEYALMFTDPWPQAAHHPAMAQAAKVAFDELRSVLTRVYAQVPPPWQMAWVERDALCIWAAIHGLASISRLDATAALGLAPAALLRAHVFGMIERSMASEPALNSKTSEKTN
ncbi:MAG: TetR/AcrR family transcriptional regulator [Betaproteobacteria bacterium]|nr:MAG: TetR/AcrR family transcriptional regulator [Betaproteobacteria bacterium]